LKETASNAVIFFLIAAPLVVVLCLITESSFIWSSNNICSNALAALLEKKERNTQIALTRISRTFSFKWSS
jgi:hypothetical protein